MNRKSHSLQLLFVVCLALIIAGCGGRGLVASQAAQGDAPPTIQFTANPATSTAGQPVTLTWSTTNTTTATLDGANIATSGTKTVNPSATQTFVLVATGAGGTATS